MKKEISYKVSGKEWEGAQEEVFKKLNSKAKIDGFRPGKAPRSVFDKKYGNKVVAEAADKLIQERYTKIITEDKIIPAIEPKVDIVKMDKDELEVKYTIIVDSEVTLGEYKNLKVKKDKVEVTKEEVDERINALLKDYAELVVKNDGTVENGDIAIIDFEGFKDGVAFDGGKGENYSLEIGSNTFIPGFEEGLIGMKKDEEKELNLTFPEDYGMEELNGAKVVFKVKVNEIKGRVIPTLDKDFFEDLGMDKITNESELRDQIESEIKEQKEHAIEHKYIDDLLDKASSNMKVEIDDEIVLAEQNRMYDEFMQRMSMQGITEELYLQYANTTKEDIISHMKEEALRRVKNRYLLEAIIKKENLKVTDEEVDKEIADMAKIYNMTESDLINAIGGKEMLSYDMTMRKAINVISGENK